MSEHYADRRIHQHTRFVDDNHPRILVHTHEFTDATHDHPLADYDIGTDPTDHSNDIATHGYDDPTISIVAPTWGDITRAPISHHYYAHRGDVEGHHHHGDDGSVLFHEHLPDAPTVVLDYHDNEYHWPNHYHHFWDTFGDLIDFGPADHDHDDTTTSLPPAASDVRT
jgi:hypothetical protein